MLLSDYLNESGETKASLSRRLGISAPAIQKWVEIPEKYLLQLSIPEATEPEIQNSEEGDDWEFHSRSWKVKDDKLIWQGASFGHGSEWDYNYSPAKIFHIRGLLKQLGRVQAVYEWVQPIAFDRSFIEAVHKNEVCPIVVDMKKRGGIIIPKRVYPFGEQDGQRIKEK